MCHYSRTDHRRSVVRDAGGRPPRPTGPEPHDVRASDSERERVVEALRVHAGEGRLSAAELEQRIEAAYAAARRDDLAAVLGDLPLQGEAQAHRRPASPRRSPQFHKTVAVAVLLVAIWALTGAGYFWPIWPVGAMAVSLAAGRGWARPPARFGRLG